MKQEMREQLKGLGLTRPMINGMAEFGVDEPADMENVTAENLVGAGLSGVLANRVISYYKKLAERAKPDPFYLAFCAMDVQEDISSFVGFMSVVGMKFDEEFMLRPAHDWGKTDPFKMFLARAILGRKPFTPAVIERLQKLYKSTEMPPEAVQWLGLEDDAMVAKYINTVPTAEDEELVETFGVLFDFRITKLEPAWALARLLSGS